MFGASPTYFVTRPDGNRTALVEVDQLPASIKIVGVSANLPAVDAANMTYVGTKDWASFNYIIETVAFSHSTNSSVGTESLLLSGSSVDWEPVSRSTNSSAGTESPLLSGDSVDGEPRNGPSKKKAQVRSKPIQNGPSRRDILLIQQNLIGKRTI